MSPTHLTLGLCALAALVEGFDTQSMGVAGPMLIKEFGLSPNQAGWLFSLGTLGQVLGAVTGGRIADRLGRKRALIVSLLVFGVCSAATALATGLTSLYVARFLTGLGLGGALPNFITMAAEAVRPERRLRAGTLIMAGLPLGGAMAGLIGLGGSAGWGWRSIFYVGAVAPMLLAFVMMRLLPEHVEQSASVATAAAASGAPSSQVGLLNGLFGEGRGMTTLVLWVSFFFIQLILLLMLNWLPTLMVGAGYNSYQASWTSVCFNVSGSVGSVLIGYLQSGKRRPLWVALTYLGIAAALIAVGFSQEAFWVVLVACGAAGLLIIGAQLAMFGLAPLYYPRSVRGTGVGAAVAVGRVGSVVGPLFAGAVLSRGASTSGVLMAIEPFVLIGGVAALLLCWRPQVKD